MNMPISGLELAAPISLACLFFLLMGLELIVPLRERKRSWGTRILVNLCVTAAAFVVGALVVRTVALGLSGWTEERGFGLVHVVDLPFGVQFVMGFLLMDLTFYYWHRANHTIPLLWRFHNVHHIDPDLDVSTSFRFHAIEVLYSSGFRALQVGLIGVAPITYVVYELFFQCSTMFHHSNVRLPIHVERVVNKLVVTPRMHGIHHSTVKDETNSNYSVIFRWWDSLHKSLRLGVPQADINIGVAGYQESDDNGLLNILLLPFLKQREYWRLADGRLSERSLPGSSPDQNILAE